eukprot:1408769-Rhodomonas_salina.2
MPCLVPARSSMLCPVLNGVSRYAPAMACPVLARLTMLCTATRCPVLTSRSGAIAYGAMHLLRDVRYRHS